MVDLASVAAKSAPHWRLSTATGQIAECYLDALDKEWMLLVWRGDELVLIETHPTREAGRCRSIEIRAEMLAEGWKKRSVWKASVVHSPRTAWLFTRGRETVRLEVRDAAPGLQLIVYGPGSKRETHDFPDTGALLVQQAEIERHLVGLGFFLERFMTDRRRYPR